MIKCSKWMLMGSDYFKEGQESVGREIGRGSGSVG